MFNSLTFFTVVIFLSKISSSGCDLTERADATQTLHSERITSWGSWGDWDYCPNGTFVIGVALKVEPLHSGTTDDDTAVNGVEFCCHETSSNSLVTNCQGHGYYKIRSKQGVWGKWPTRFDSCPDGLASGFQLRVEPPAGFANDRSVLSLSLFCSGGQRLYPNNTNEFMGFGNWEKELHRCQLGKAICAVRTQVEDSQGSTWPKGDDTALNNVDVKCCDLPRHTAKQVLHSNVRKVMDLFELLFPGFPVPDFDYLGVNKLK